VRSFVLILALIAPAAAAAPSPRAPLASGPPTVGPDAVALIVKWRDDAVARPTRSGAVALAQGRSPAELEAAMAVFGLFFEPWLDVEPQRLRDLESRAAARSGRAQPDLGGLHRVWVRDPSPERLVAAADLLARLPDVEFVTAEDRPPPPPFDIPPETPNLVGNQAWLDAARGLDAWSAWDRHGLDGSGVRLADCEYGWHRSHEDLSQASWFEEPGQTPVPNVASNGWDHHGTAVAGQLVGQHNGYGVHGLAPGADFASYPEWTVEGGYRRGSAIASAIADSRPGDVVLLEMQANGPDGRFAPAEVNPAVWTLVRAGSDAGVLVVGAAGNGAADLDGDPYATYRSWGDSGAMIVGGGTSDGRRARAGGSTYGARVDLQGWYQSVFTTGYGGFARYGGDILQTYTATFGGTSGASPFVAGAATLVQQAALRYRRDPLSPAEMRELLASTGKPAAAGARIGPLPDLAAAVDEVVARYDVPPAILSLDLPARAAEGDTIALSVAFEVLPTHVAAIAWTVGAEVADGPELSFVALDDGVIEGVVRVTDEWGRFDERAFAIVVDNVAPTLGPIQVQGPLLEGSALRLSAELSDPGVHDVHTWAWEIDGVPAGSDPVLHMIPRQDGRFRVVAVASDGDGGVSEPAEILLDIADVPATLTLDLPEDARRRTPATLTVVIDDPGADTHEVVWSVDAGGEIGRGATIAHAFDAKGPTRVTATVTDQDGVVVTATGTVGVLRRGCGCASSPVGGGWLGALALAAVARRRRR
jgi:MYXO-CTERM domain-containing protein